MAVAVKNTPETTSSSAFDRLPIASLVGAFYVLLGLGIAFNAIPLLWKSWIIPTVKLGIVINDIDISLVAFVIVAIAGLAYLGVLLFGADAAKGAARGYLPALRQPWCSVF